MSFQIEVALYEAPKGIPNYFIGNEETLRPWILDISSTSPTSPIGVISDFPKLIFKPETVSKHKVLGPFFKDISSEIDREEDALGMGLCGCVKVRMETRCSSGQKREFRLKKSW
jgi:hypothetical protein